MTWTKLHYLCGAKTTPLNIHAILQQCRLRPTDICAVDDNGFTCLHIEVIRHDLRAKVIQALVQASPQAVTKKDHNGNTPLHLAMCPGVDSTIIRLMIEACPNAAYEKDKEGLMPLHVACRHCPDKIEVIRMLLEANPNALHSRTRMGNPVPKKNTSSSLAPVQLVQDNQHVVLDGVTSSAWKESQIKSNAQGWLEYCSQLVCRHGSYPLHIAVTNGAPQSVLKMLIDGAPEIASKSDKFGRTCLHLAVGNGGTVENEINEETLPKVTVETLKLIHSANTSQIKARDQAGKLPLRVALETFPDVIYAKNKEGNCPVEVAEHCRCRKEELMEYLQGISSSTPSLEVAQ